MKGSTWGWVVGAVVVIAIILGAWWWQMNSQTSVTPVPYGTATSTDALASNNLPPTKLVVEKVAAGNLVTVLAGIPDVSRFDALLTSSGVAATLGGKGPYTLFVPTNESANLIPANMTAAQLKRFVQYHIVTGKNINVNVQTAGTIQALSKDMLNFSVRTGDKSARINSSVALQKYTTSNGTIYLIDQPHIPPLAAQQ